MAFRILEFPLGFNHLFFQLRLGDSFPREPHYGERLSFSAGKGDGAVRGGGGGQPVPLPEPENRVGNSAILVAGSNSALPSAVWAGARQFQGARACLSAPGALCLGLAAWAGCGWGGSGVLDLSGVHPAGQASAAPCLPRSLAPSDCTGQR